MKGMILAAGYGERLWPLTAHRTKPALPVLGKPLVGYVVEYLAKHGINEVVVNLHHRPESVRAALGEGHRYGVKLDYVHEPVILGTSGALDNARDLFDQKTFVVINGKIITDIDLSAALKTHRRTGALATLILKRNDMRERFSVVETNQGSITRFAGMPSNDMDISPLMFTGIQILEPRIFDYIPRGVFSHSTTDVYPQAIAKGELIAAHVGEGQWFELSTLQRYLDISLALLKDDDRSLYMGNAPSIAEDAEVQDAILWDDVVVKEGAKVTRAVVGDGVRIESHQNLCDAVVVTASVVSGQTPPAKALKGHIEGDNFVVPLARC